MAVTLGDARAELLAIMNSGHLEKVDNEQSFKSCFKMFPSLNHIKGSHSIWESVNMTERSMPGTELDTLTWVVFISCSPKPLR